MYATKIGKFSVSRDNILLKEEKGGDNNEMDAISFSGRGWKLFQLCYRIGTRARGGNTTFPLAIVCFLTNAVLSRKCCFCAPSTIFVLTIKDIAYFRHSTRTNAMTVSFM